MTVVGIGVDIVTVSRVDRLIASGGRRFLERWFRPAEVVACLASAETAHRAAAHLAAKEATFKSLHAPSAGPVPWRDIEVVAGAGAQPTVVLHGSLHLLAETVGASQFHICMSHDACYALATVIAVSDAVTPRSGAG